MSLAASERKKEMVQIECRWVECSRRWRLQQKTSDGRLLTDGTAGQAAAAFSYLRTLTTWHCPHSPAARRCCSNRSVSPARRAHSSKPAEAGLLLWIHPVTDRRMDTRMDTGTPHHFIGLDPATHTMWAVPIAGDEK